MADRSTDNEVHAKCCRMQVARISGVERAKLGNLHVLIYEPHESSECDSDDLP